METIITLTKEDINIQLLEILKNMFSPMDNELVVTIKSKSKVGQSIKPMTIDEYNKRLALSEEAVKNGKIFTQVQVLNQIKTWKQTTAI